MSTLVSSHVFNRARLVEDVLEQIDRDVHNQLLADAKLDALITRARPGYEPTPPTRKAIREMLALRFQRKPLTLSGAINILTED